MSLFKRKAPPEPTGRQRIIGERPQAPTAFSYRSARLEQELNTGRQIDRSDAKAERLSTGISRSQRLGAGLLVVVVVIGLFAILSLSTNPQIKILSSSDTSFLQDSSTYQQAANKLFAASLWNHNKLTVDTSKISSQLTSEFPEITATSITVPLIAHRPVIYIQPAVPALILATNSGSYVLDTTGKVITDANTESLSGLHLPTVTDQTSVVATPGQKALTSSNVSFIQTVIAELVSRQFAVSSLTLPAGVEELDVRLTGQPYYIKFNLQNNDARQQVGTFLAVENTLKSQNTTPAQYIDVRVDGRAYYQ